MGRISREVMFMDMARAASKRSTCFRLNVGAIVTQHHSPVSVGWNGAASGEPHCAGNDCPGIVPGNCGTLHAEANALQKAESIMAIGDEVHLYVTDSPCPQCCLRIMNSPLYVTKIFYEKPYRLDEHLGMLKRYSDPEDHDREGDYRHTEVYLVTPAGYIVDHFTRHVVELP